MFAAVACAALLASACGGRDDRHYVSAPIRGDLEMVERFRGDWYYQGRLLLSVRGRWSPVLSVWAEPGDRIEDVHTVETGIQFSYVGENGVRSSVLGMRPSGMAILVRPGMDPEVNWFCGTCYPRLERTPWVRRVLMRVKWRLSRLMR
ncbi:MAG TPA: hypothetical protein ENK10_10310 [Acidobacteria bacterium]|nr:hypothetical protein [Acidobacteriota bacterium]